MTVESCNNNADCPIAYLGDVRGFDLSDYNEAIRLKPDSAIIHNNRGAAYLALGQYQKAVEDFSEAVKIKPDYVDAYYNRANVYFDHMNKEDGCNDAQKACALGKCDLLEKVKGKGYCS